MKKLNKVLFGFGTVAAVVAPVVSVVACGDDTPTDSTAVSIKLSDEAAVINFAKEKGYAVTNDIAKEILANVGKGATITHVIAGQLTDATHGKDDFAVVIKGTTKQETLTTAKAELLSQNLGYSDLTTKGEGTTTSLGDRWGLTEANTAEATSILYFQNDGTEYKVNFVQVAKTADGKIVTKDVINKAFVIWTVAKATK